MRAQRRGCSSLTDARVTLPGAERAMTTHFQHAETHLRQVDGAELGTLLEAAADLAVILDGADVVQDLACRLEDASALGIPAWRTRPFAALVEPGSRARLARLLGRARAGDAVELELLHVCAERVALPIRYGAFRLRDAEVLLLGRDRRALAELSSRLLATLPAVGGAAGARAAPPALAADVAEAISRLHGSLPLKNVVHGATDALERICIEAALRMTGDNRSAAARVLGLSRQSLYVKLRRFGLATPEERELNAN
jgi:DNA-binding protein Fis